MRPYTIGWNGWDHQSGGVRALHALKGALNAAGCNTHMADDPIKDSIVIYPEVVQGDPLGAGPNRRVRWFLNRTTDHVLPATDSWWQWGGALVDETPLLTTHIFERNFWRPAPEERERGKVGYWIGKGKRNFDRSVLPHHAIEIRKDNYPSRFALSNLVRSLDTLISFDPYTALITEALLCGVMVMVHAPDDPFVEVARQHPWNRYGVAWGMKVDEWLWAHDTIDEAHDWYYGVCKPSFDKQLENFIAVTQALE